MAPPNDDTVETMGGPANLLDYLPDSQNSARNHPGLTKVLESPPEIGLSEAINIFGRNNSIANPGVSE